MVCYGKLNCQYRFGNPIYTLEGKEGKCQFLELNQKENKEEYKTCNNEEWESYTRPEIEYSQEGIIPKTDDFFSYSWQKQMHKKYINSDDWKFKVRPKVINKDKGNCTEKGCEKAGEEVHHRGYSHWYTDELIKFKSERGGKTIIKTIINLVAGETKSKLELIELMVSYDLDNLNKLQSLCTDCHRKIHGKKIENENGQKIVEDFMGQ